MPCPVEAATVAVENGELKLATTAAGMNVIDVAPEGLAFHVHDSVDPVATGEGCIPVSPQDAVCGGMITLIRVECGGGEDLLGLWDVKVPVIARGGDGDDLIETGAGADEIDAGAGQDAVDGRKGDDTLTGGADRDRIEGGKGDDMLAGEDGADVLRGGRGDDQIAGGDSGDLIAGGAGTDQISPGAGDNAVVATKGTDTVTTTAAGNDVVFTRPRAPGKLRCRRSSRSKRVDCASTRTEVVERPPPTAWPRSTASTAPTASAAAVKVTVIPRYPTQATRLSITVKTKKTRRVRVCVRLEDRDERFIGRFPARVDTKKDTIKSPRKKTATATGKRRKKGCRRRLR